MRPVIHECRKICKKYSAKVYFKSLKSSEAGYCDYENSNIYISSNFADRNIILSVLFHELGHLECYRSNKWKNYHRAERAKEQINCGLKAERYCDRWAEMELYKYDKRVKYIKFYEGSNKELRKFLSEFIYGNIDLNSLKL